MNPVSVHLDQLRKDARFAAVTEPADHHVLLSLWVLELRLDAVTEDRLLYGWVLPRPATTRANWSTVKPPQEALSSDASGKYRLGRVSWTGPTAIVCAILEALGEGKCLTDAAVAAGIAGPEAYGSLRLGKTGADVEKRYLSGPVVFVTQGAERTMRDRFHRSWSSPSERSPMFVGPLWRVAKTALWRVDFYAENGTRPGRKDHPILPGGDDLASQCLRHLAVETGLSFEDADAGRLGNIEWLVPTAIDFFEKKCVSAKSRRRYNEDDKINIDGFDIMVTEGLLPKGTRLRIRTHIYYGEETGVDEIRPFTVGDPAYLVPCRDEASRIALTIWREDDLGHGEIWHEEDTMLVRQIVMNLGIGGLSGLLESTWSKAMDAAGAKIKERVAKVSRIDQQSYSTIVSGQRSPLELADQEMRHLARRLFPEKSDGEFFPKGWIGEGGLNFIEWFQSLTETPDASAIVFVDPFIDDVALSEFLPRTKSTQCEYVVITNTQVPLKNDTPTAAASAAQPQRVTRRDRIIDTCRRHRGVLSHLNLTILDAQSTTAGKQDQLFHDRYIFLYKGTEVARGFHLSNSFQGATKNDPLLITPIPSDVLEKVTEYVDLLRRGDAHVIGAAATVTPLFSSESLRKERVHQIGLTRHRPTPEFFSVLLNEPSLMTASEDTIDAAVREAGLAEEKDHYIAPAAAEATVTTLLEKICNADATTAAEIWTSFAFWRYHMADGQEGLKRALTKMAPRLTPVLEHLVQTVPERLLPTGTKDYFSDDGAFELAHAYHGSFAQAMSLAERILTHAHPDYSGDVYPFSWGLEVLMELDPPRLVSALDRIVASVPVAERHYANSPGNLRVAPILKALPYTLASHDNELQVAPALVDSSVPLLRAMGLHLLFARKTVEDAVNAIPGSLARDELRLALAEVVFDVRVEANRNQHNEPDAARTRKVSALKAMQAVWPDQISDEELNKLVERLSGPLAGSWATSTTAELFQPLIEAGKLSWDRCLSLWGTLLVNHLDQHEQGKYHFFANSDASLTEAFAKCFAQVDEKTRKTWWDKVIRPVDRLVRRLLGPFSRSRDYSAWSNARETLEWLWCVSVNIRLVGQSMPKGELDKYANTSTIIGSTLSEVPSTRSPELALVVKQHVDKLRAMGENQQIPFMEDP